MAAPQRRRAAGAVLPGTYRAARMSQGRARAPNALGAAGGAPPAPRHPPQPGRGALQAQERVPGPRAASEHSARPAAAASTPPPERRRDGQLPPARPSAHAAAPRGPVRPRGERGPHLLCLQPAPPAHRSALQGGSPTRPRTSHRSAAGRAGRDCRQGLRSLT